MKIFAFLFLAFNGNNDHCLCIMSRRFNNDFNNDLHMKILPNTSCDHYCDYMLTDTKSKQKFSCGSSKNSRIWAKYNLNASCPVGSVYIKESQCMSTYRGPPSSCPSPLVKYVYDGNIKWKVFLKIIEKLNLTTSVVAIDFHDDIIIDSSWKCSSEVTGNTRNSYPTDKSYPSENFTMYYLLDGGCLRAQSYSFYKYRSLNRLCITSYENERSSLYNRILFQSFPNRICPPHWLDLNNKCYRMSNENKTIQEARNSCSSLSVTDQKKLKSVLPIFPDVDDDGMNDTSNEFYDPMIHHMQGEVVQYLSSWQARLGFFLLDTSNVFKRISF